MRPGSSAGGPQQAPEPKVPGPRTAPNRMTPHGRRRWSRSRSTVQRNSPNAKRKGELRELRSCPRWPRRRAGSGGPQQAPGPKASGQRAVQDRTTMPSSRLLPQERVAEKGETRRNRQQKKDRWAFQRFRPWETRGWPPQQQRGRAPMRPKLRGMRQARSLMLGSDSPWRRLRPPWLWRGGGKV